MRARGLEAAFGTPGSANQARLRLGAVDRLHEVPPTTRTWKAMTAVVRALETGAHRGSMMDAVV